MKGMPGAQSGTVATMRIFGVSRQQNSICCHVHGFAPYLYVTVPSTFKVLFSIVWKAKQYYTKVAIYWNIVFYFTLKPEHCKQFHEALNKALIADSRSKQEIHEFVLEVEFVEKESMYGYHENKKSPFLKVTSSCWLTVGFMLICCVFFPLFGRTLLQITLALPPFIAATKRLLERGEIAPPFNSMSYVAYESNIDFEIRWAINRVVDSESCFPWQLSLF